MNNKLINHLKELLIKNNYLDLYTFLDVILYDRQFGFYNSINFEKKELIGKKGHFITAPEISQLFGELVGIWILLLCRKNHFHNINLLELGPGKGTLMRDILRIFSQQKENIKIIKKQGSTASLNSLKNLLIIQNFKYFSFIFG